jgi:uncharacterized protein YbjT (DUF2867 family)
MCARGFLEHEMELSQPILVTGASGKTGQRVVAAIARKGGKVRALVRRPDAGAALQQAGAAEVAVGDLLDRDSLQRAMMGAGQVLHICPPMHPQEDEIARTMIELAGEVPVDRFVLYSVLHPLLADVPHHDRKLQAERALVDSGLNYTILQPGRYMQHLAVIWKAVLATGVHSMPFSTASRFSLTDLSDLAEASARIMTEDGHDAATYQLAGPDALSQDDCAAILTRVLGRPIRAVAKPLEEFQRDAAAAGLPAERITGMTRMNRHYDGHGLIGNPNVLRWILGREPGRFADYVVRELPLS